MKIYAQNLIFFFKKRSRLFLGGILIFTGCAFAHEKPEISREPEKILARAEKKTKIPFWAQKESRKEINAFQHAHAPKKSAKYRVHIDADLAEIEVQACFTGRMPTFLWPGAKECAPFLRNASIGAANDSAKQMRSKQRKPLYMRNNKLALLASAPNCVRYVVDVKSALLVAPAKIAEVEDASVLLSTDLWLWHPRDRTIELELDLPEGVFAALPFKMNAATGLYTVPNTAFRWLSTSAFGSFRSYNVMVQGGVLDVHLLDSSLSKEKTKAWLKAAGDSVASIYGRFPRKRVQVFVRDALWGISPVVFGQVARGGGPVVTFYVADDKANNLIGEWVAAHEFSHLLVPYIRKKDTWLREGLATWYQNIARMRVGQMTVEAGWEKIVRGLKRGAAASSKGTILQMSEGMQQSHSYAFVYWVGAAASLLMDVEARRNSAGKVSLDKALGLVGPALFQQEKVLSASEFASALDEAIGMNHFAPFVESFLTQEGFPQMQRVLWRLGVHERRDGSIWLDDHAEDAWIRQAIELGE